MDLFWQMIRMTKNFGMAWIRIRYCTEGNQDEIYSSFVVPFVWFTRTGSFLNSTRNFILAIAAPSERTFGSFKGQVQSRKRSSVHVAQLGPGDLRWIAAP